MEFLYLSKFLNWRMRLTKAKKSLLGCKASLPRPLAILNVVICRGILVMSNKTARIVEDLYLRTNQTFRKTWVWLDANKDPVPLDDCTAKLQFKSPFSCNGEQIIYDELTTDPDDGITLTAAEGKIELLVPRETVSTFSWDESVYDLIITFPDGGDDVCFAEGKGYVEQGITEVS